MSDEQDKSGLNTNQINTLNRLIDGMKFGTITIIVQDGKIVQVDKTEKHRL